MDILNNIQYRAYNRAQALTRFFNESTCIYASFTPFAKEVATFLRNVEGIPAFASIKEINGTGVTLQKKALKKIIAREGAYICNIATAYALHTANNELKYAVAYTYTNLFTTRDIEVASIGRILSRAITPFLNDKEFQAYGITAADLSSLIEKGDEYNRSLFEARMLNRDSDLASQDITDTLKKIQGNIAQFKRLLSFFEANHPDFVAAFHGACMVHNTGAHVNAIEGTITEGSTGELVVGVSIVGESNNKTAITNAMGFYRLTCIKTGNYTFTITAKGYATEVVKVKVVRGKTIAFNIKLVATPVMLPAEEAA